MNSIEFSTFELEAFLIVLYPQEHYEQYPLHIGTNIIGRGTEADIRLNDPLISRKHCEIQWDGRTLKVKDLHSTNGLFLNGEEIIESTLDSKSRLQLGKTVLKIKIKQPHDSDFSKTLFDQEHLDPVTQICKPESFKERAKGEIAFAKRNRFFVHLYRIQVDFSIPSLLKPEFSIEDLFLKEITRLLKIEIREVDLVSYFGSRTFMWLHLSEKPENSLEVASKLQEKLNKHIFTYNDFLVNTSALVNFSSKNGAENPNIDELLKEVQKHNI
ncbi:MAG: FHA domain-containing protein [Fibrobacter sp.]|jgi:GGDEF domain-containing protein|nr:FHA domain-containing protein [Fibrobacter sp.]